MTPRDLDAGIRSHLEHPADMHPSWEALTAMREGWVDCARLLDAERALTTHLQSEVTRVAHALTDLLDAVADLPGEHHAAVLVSFRRRQWARQKSEGGAK